MNLCNYNLNATIINFLPAFKINVESLYVNEEYSVEDFTIRSGIEYTVWFEREIGEKNFKYMNGMICRNNSPRHPFEGITCYAFGFINKEMLIKIGFHGKRKII
jgi:hypothetical protein